MKKRIVIKRIEETYGKDSFPTFIFSQIIKEYHGQKNLEFITLSDFSQYYGIFTDEKRKAEMSKNIMDVLVYFCDKKIKLLKMVYEYTNGMFVQQISNEYLENAISTGVYLNPITGSEDNEFMQHITVKFELTPRMKAFL